MKSILNTLFGKPKSTKSVAAARAKFVASLNKKDLGNLTAKNVRGLFDSIESCVYFDDGTVVQVPGRYLRTLKTRSKAEFEIQKWAQYRGLIKQGEFIAVR